MLTQISAATKALQSVAVELLDDHIRHCIAGAAVGSTAEVDRLITEATHAVARLVRS